ncbi:NADH dehydrogenase subunit G [Salmonella enterica subsp. enterica serovar Heidelberg str. N189]|nr:NADH dehydrogenase subunit G [Salmonella enterica subsp. enterica serovar Heidelberg str. N189]
MGLGMMGGGSLDDALGELETGSADAVVVLEKRSPPSCKRYARERRARQSAAGDGG